jgi:hypothetical protein
MGSDEEPNDIRVVFDDAHGTIGITDSHGIHRQDSMQPFELQTWMGRVGLKPTIGLAGSLLNILRQSSKRTSK